MMNKRIVLALGAALLLCFAAGTLMAIDIVVPGQATPAQVVAARKFAMMANAVNAGDLSAKLTAGNIKAMAANARALAALGAYFPVAFAEAYPEAYPVAGSKYFFKSGPMDQFQALAQSFTTAAEELLKLAEKESKDGVTAQMPKLFGACNACHAVFRGGS
jgi:cytochrome c556